LLEARILAGKIIDTEKDQNESKYSISQLAEVIAHPYLNNDLVMEMTPEEREKKVKELEEFYGVSVSEILAFIEFKNTEKQIKEFELEERKRLNKKELNEEEQEQVRGYEAGVLGKFFKSETSEKEKSPSLVHYNEHVERTEDNTSENKNLKVAQYF
jgi:hypothetical protein